MHVDVSDSFPRWFFANPVLNTKSLYCCCWDAFSSRSERRCRLGWWYRLWAVVQHTRPPDLTVVKRFPCSQPALGCAGCPAPAWLSKGVYTAAVAFKLLKPEGWPRAWIYLGLETINDIHFSLQKRAANAIYSGYCKLRRAVNARLSDWCAQRNRAAHDCLKPKP